MKAEIKKQLEESIMGDKNVNTDLLEKFKIAKKGQKLLKKWRKSLRVINVTSYV